MINSIRLFFKKRSAGQSLIELLVAIGLAALLIPAVFVGLMSSRGSRTQQEQRTQAVSVLKNAQEAVRTISYRDWTEVATNGTFYTEISGDRWVLMPGTQTANGLTQSVVISDVSRDNSGAIVALGGTLDPSTKKVDITVAWSSPFSSSVTSSNYITRHRNIGRIDTTVADFTPGETSPGTTGIAITNSAGGEVVLGAGGGGGDWCQPSLTLDTLNLPKNGVANAISAIEGKVAAGTGDNSSGISFASVDITTTHPPTATLQETFDGYKTNDVFGEEDFAYLATDNNGKEIVIVNLNEYSDPPTNSKYEEEGYFDAPGNGNGNTVTTSGNYGYMTSGNKFYIFDLTSKSGSRAKINTTDVTLSGTGVKVIVNGGYAFVATTATSSQLQIIDLSNPVSPTIVRSVSVTGQGGKGLSINATGTRAYLATGESSSQREFFIIDTTNKSSATPVTGGTYDTNSMNPKGVTVVTGNRAIIVGTGGTYQYQVINIANENAPVNCGSMAVTSGINGVSSVLQSNGYAYSYIITGDSSDELKIILGGAGAGNNYNSSGVYESATFDPGYDAAFNSISATVSVPSQTTLQYKIAIKDAVNNSCSSVIFSDTDFVGPNGLTTDFFPSTGGILPFNNDGADYENPGRCMKYRMYMTSTDPTQSPVVYDFSVNYSP